MTQGHFTQMCRFRAFRQPSKPMQPINAENAPKPACGVIADLQTDD
jgi:hypothetical protein